MSSFADRERNEEQLFRHDEELRFRIRHRRNRLFGHWIATSCLDLAGSAADDYATDVVMADLGRPGGGGMLAKVKADLAAAGRTVSDHRLERRLDEMAALARRRVMSE